MKRYLIDWKLLGGFIALLILMIIIGFIGISQIQSSSETIDNLGRRYLPMQRAAFEMRVSNSLYAMRIRNYVFWKSSRYIEAARVAGDLGAVQEAAAGFDRQLEIYAANIKEGGLIAAGKQKEWISQITNSEKELRSVGSMIISSVDQNSSYDSINKLLMTFESRLYRIDDFLDKTVQNENLNAVKEQLKAADSDRNQAILLLSWSLIFGVLIGSETAWLVYLNRKRESQRRQDMVLQMIRTEERERQNLSAQVHDQMGQDLSAAKIYLDLLEQSMPDMSGQPKERLEQGKKIISGLLEKTHNISMLLRPPALDEVGLLESIEALLIDFKQLTGASYIYHKPEEELRLSPEHSLFIYRLTQEALTNAARHAQARNVELRLEKADNLVRLFYQDDGKGFDYSQFVLRPRRRAEDRLRLGLLGLRERVELLGGVMKIDTAPGKGTRIVVELNC